MTKKEINFKKLSKIKKRYGVIGVIFVVTATLFGGYIEDYISRGFTSTLQTFEINEIELESVILKRVVDGDTLIATNSNNEDLRIRLIGVDTPESVHPDKDRNTQEGDLASQYTKSLLKVGQKLYLEYDVQKTDRYNRVLAYVWLSDEIINDNISETMLNAKLVADGYAVAKEFKPNVKYSTLFKNLEK